jgi:hypothetical protein
MHKNVIMMKWPMAVLVKFSVCGAITIITTSVGYRA